MRCGSKKKPNVGHVRVFGCIAHMKVPSCQTGKLDDRSVKVVNLGKEPGTKAYRLYDPEKKRICVSRDVVFEEDKQWVWNDQEDVTDCNEWFVIPGVIREEDVNTQGPDNESEDSVNNSDGEIHTGSHD